MKQYLDHNIHPKTSAFSRSIFYWIAFMLLLFLFGSLLVPLFPAKWERFLYGTSGSVAAFFITWLFLKNENKTFRGVGLIWEAGTIARFLKGMLIGGAIFAMIILALISFTELRFERNPAFISPVASFWYLSIIPLALMEEVAFRSYPFVKLHKALGLWPTQFIVAIAFALYHVVGGQSFYGSLIGPGVWAFVFGLAAASSKGIALPLGIHTALNILQPLTGMKSGKYASLWIIKSDASVTHSLIKSGNAGWIIQLVVFVLAIVLTAVFLRKNKSV